MTRQPWTEEEVQFLRDFPNNWEAFHTEFPTRSYNSWEVKRRRLNGGSAGTRDSRPQRYVESDRLALAMLELLAGYVEGRLSRETEFDRIRHARGRIRDRRKAMLAQIEELTVGLVVPNDA